MERTELLFQLGSQVGVSGLETSAIQFAKELIKPYAKKVVVDRGGSLLATIVEPKEGKPHILLDAHIDEIGLIVTGVTSGGFLRVAACGGVDRKLLLAQEVLVHGNRDVYAVVASKPPHLETAEDQKKSPEIDQILLDTGLTEQQAKEWIPLGSRVSFCARPQQLLNGRVSCKSMDDRSGVASIFMALEQLKEKELSCGLSVLFSSQEETGERGAKTGAFGLGVTHCIAVDVSFAYTSDAPEHKCGKLSQGVMIGISPTLDVGISQELEELAKQYQIPYQLEVMGGATSTNADSLALTGAGIRCGLCSIPLRYMHTPIEVIDPQDVQSVADLLAAYVLKMGG